LGARTVRFLAVRVQSDVRRRGNGGIGRRGFAFRRSAGEPPEPRGASATLSIRHRGAWPGRHDARARVVPKFPCLRARASFGSQEPHARTRQRVSGTSLHDDLGLSILIRGARAGSVRPDLVASPCHLSAASLGRDFVGERLETISHRQQLIRGYDQVAQSTQSARLDRSIDPLTLPARFGRLSHRFF